MTDRERLERFLATKDELAFEEIVRAHGSMVLSVCRRILNHQQDAEDAYQATFLVLARQAGKIVSRQSLASWLFGVAQRTALNLRRMKTHRDVLEKRKLRDGMTKTECNPQTAWDDAAEVLDEELSRLPEMYRTAVLLCDLEGKSQKEAALDAGCPEGTLSSRLTRGREMLRIRLVRRGIVLSTTALILGLSESARANVPASLISVTVKAAVVSTATPGVMTGIVSDQVVQLSTGVIKAMTFSTMKQVIVALVLIGLGSFGAGGVYYQMQAAEGKKAATLEKGLQELQGTWRVLKMEKFGTNASKNELDRTRPMLEIKEKTFTLTAMQGGKAAITEGDVKIDASKDPAWLDMNSTKGNSNMPPPIPSFRGIYKLDGETLTWCATMHLDGKSLTGGEVERPTTFETEKPSGLSGGGVNRKVQNPTRIMFTFERVQEKEKK